MMLDEFKAMWESDGLHLVQEDRRQADGATWLLFNVTEPESTDEYGRHYALIVVVKEERILAHNFKNISSRDTRPWRQQVWEWWEEHVAEGLVDASGQPICA